MLYPVNSEASRSTKRERNAGVIRPIEQIRLNNYRTPLTVPIIGIRSSDKILFVREKRGKEKRVYEMSRMDWSKARSRQYNASRV